MGSFMEHCPNPKSWTYSLKEQYFTPYYFLQNLIIEYYSVTALKFMSFVNILL